MQSRKLSADGAMRRSAIASDEGSTLAVSLAPAEQVRPRRSNSSGTSSLNSELAEVSEKEEFEEQASASEDDEYDREDSTYSRRLLLSALNAVAVNGSGASASRTSSSVKWAPIRRKSALFKRKRRPSLGNVVEIYERPQSMPEDVGLLDGGPRLGNWSKSKLDLVPGLRSLMSVTAHKLSGSGSGSGSGASKLRRNISLNDVAEPSSVSRRLRKCNTVLTLAGTQLEPLRPVNRLRPGAVPSQVCSRCSSLLSMASSSRYSLSSSHGFVAASTPTVLCKVCLNEVPIKDSWTLQLCECSYCVDCVRSYVEFEITQGAYSISCPDAQCEKQGIILLEEIESLVSFESVDKYKRYRLNKEVEMDKSRTWCPQAGCETVCTLCSTDRSTPQSVRCPTCETDFCANCRAAWHPDSPCRSEEAVPGVTFDSELIKCCPMCSVPIEKDEGCAQMLCKRCKHVFCWYCLASLDDDFLLRHYDKGPCKNKLGHSRASVIWHRTQVISIFAGFGILLLIASPLLLLAAPCIVCCKCRVCTSDAKLDDDIPEVAEEEEASGSREEPPK